VNPFGHMRSHGETWKVWATTDALPGTAYFGVTGYYAAFFADPSGNRLEVYVRPSED